MKSLSDVKRIHDLFEKEYGWSAKDAGQGSEEWFRTKLGVISSSNAEKVVAKSGSDTRASYMASLIAQVCTGIFEEVNSKYMDWGKMNEAAARSYYEFSTGEKIIELPFVFKDESRREGCSPDGILASGKKGAEIKCPYNTLHYIKFLTEDTVKPEYKWQCQHTLRVMEAETWDFVNYDPRMRAMPMHTLTVERDEEKQKTMDDAIPQFISDMDKKLAQIGIEFGSQWRIS